MQEATLQIEHCDLCLIGTGIAGLNALNSAASYLSKKDKVLIVDRRAPQQAIGGMWNSVYPFVRLHQPHPLFTVGNEKWTTKEAPSYLAKQSEILAHFQECYQKIQNKLQVVEQFGYEYQGHEEVAVDGGYEAHIQFKAVHDGLPPLLVKAKRCIKALGFNVAPTAPLSLSTDQVRSTVPEAPAILDGTIANDDKPIYLIGSGKTSMDTANAILAQNPKRKINFILGKGTFFLNRAIFFPAGAQRNWNGVPLNGALLDIAQHYRADDLDGATEYIKNTYGVTPFKEASHNILGVLSPEEAASVRQGIDTEVNDYLDDIKEVDGQLWMHFKSGQKQTIEAGSWIINCTGFLYREPENFQTEPIVSPHGTVLSIQKVTSTVIFTSFAGYFLPHVWFRDKFKEVPVHYFNHHRLMKKSKKAFLFAISAQAVYNLIRFIDALPLSVVYNCGLNYDKWFPLHRQLPFLTQVILNKKKHLRETKAVLDQIMKEYDIEHGVVGQ